VGGGHPQRRSFPIGIRAVVEEGGDLLHRKKGRGSCWHQKVRSAASKATQYSERNRKGLTVGEGGKCGKNRLFHSQTTGGRRPLALEVEKATGYERNTIHFSAGGHDPHRSWNHVITTSVGVGVKVRQFERAVAKTDRWTRRRAITVQWGICSGNLGKHSSGQRETPKDRKRHERWEGIGEEYSAGSDTRACDLRSGVSTTLTVHA